MNKKHLLSFVALAAVLAMVPLIVVNPYYLHLIETILIYAVLLLGLDIVVGYTGQVSFGQNAFAAIGGYTSAVLTTAYGWGVFPAMALGVAPDVLASAAKNSALANVISSDSEFEGHDRDALIAQGRAMIAKAYNVTSSAVRILVEV